jgi:hypothetical protein
MDSTLVGVIVGSLLSFLGTYAGHWFTMRREEKQWHRQQEAEREKRIREARKANREAIRNAYQNCIHTLSLLVATEFNEESLKTADEERLDIYREAHRWLTLVALYLRDREGGGDTGNASFYSTFRHFAETANKHSASSLRDRVIEFALNDRRLFPDAPIQAEDPSERRVMIQIDQAFRRRQFLEGVELPESYEFGIRIEDLTPEQRRKLWDTFFDTYKEVPRRFGGLPVPSYNEEKKQIILRGGNWAARMNPLVSDPKDIIRAWELDYEKSLEEAQRRCETHSETL